MPLGEETEKNYKAQWDKNVKDFERKGGKIGTSKDWDAWNKYMHPFRQQARKWLEDENKRRAAKGVPLMVESDLDKIIREKLKIKYDGSPASRDSFKPSVPNFKQYNNQTLYAAYEPLLKKNYDQRSLPRPQLNIILLLSRDGDWDQKRAIGPRSWARANKDGAMRILRAGKPVSEYEN